MNGTKAAGAQLITAQFIVPLARLGQQMPAQEYAELLVTLRNAIDDALRTIQARTARHS